MQYADRVKDTTQTAGVGDFLLDLAVISGYQQFSQAFPLPTRITYACVSPASSLWEVGKGTFDGVNTITRDVVEDGSSGPGVKVAFGSTVKDIFVTVSADAFRRVINLQYVAARGMLGQ